MRKRLKYDKLYVLPVDVLELIIEYISRKDIINLSSTNKTVRTEFKWLLFQKMKGTWHDIQNPDFQKFCLSNKQFIQTFRIVDCFGYGEWQIDIFERILNKLQARELIINSYNSSNWLKYRKGKFERMELHYDPSQHDESTYYQQNPNPKNIVRLSHNQGSPKIFDLNHLVNFPNIKYLTLHKYHFNWQDHNNNIHLKVLKLINCSWDYPFQLHQFDPHQSLTELHLVYTDNNSFILLERFSTFLNEPKVTQLNHLLIILHTTTIVKTLSKERLSVFFNQRLFPKLKTLNLIGWKYDYHFLKSFINSTNCQIEKIILSGKILIVTNGRVVKSIENHVTP